MADQINGRSGAQFDVTTYSIDLYNASTRLSISLYNKNLQLGIINAVKDESGRLRYPTNNAISALITPERAMILSDIIANELTPAMKEGKTFQKSIILNQKMSTILTIENDDTGNISIYIYTDIGESRIPQKIARYTFSVTQCMSKYDPKTGEYEQGESSPTQFYLFARCIEDFTYNVSCTAAHFNRVATNYNNKKLMNTLYEIASKLGISVSMKDSGSSSYHYGESQANFNMNQNTLDASNAASASPTTATLSDMASGDLPF